MTKKTRVLLISPTNGLYAGSPVRPKFQTHPLGLLYIASVLEGAGFEVGIYDAYSFGHTLGDIKAEVERFRPQIVGITAMTILAKDAYRTAETVKGIDASITVVMGGSHSTAMPDEALETGHIDISVIGEGEDTMHEISEAVERGDLDFSQINGIVFKRDGGFIRTPARARSEALDEIPFPAYHLLPSVSDYNPPPHWGKKGRFAAILTCRGCPYKCPFCSVTRDWGRKYRYRSPENVLDELEYLNKTYGVTYVSIRDSVFTLHKQRAIDICKGIVDRGLKITWNCNARVNEVSEELLSWMKKAGCKAIQYGIESGNDELLAQFKGVDKALITRAIDMTSKQGIESHGYFMFGLPGETKDTMKETMEFAKTLKLHSAGFTSVTPFPGSDLWDYCEDNDLILTRDWSKYDFKEKPPSRHKTLSPEDIYDAQKAAFRMFYLRPKVVLRFLKNVRRPNDLLNYFFGAMINLRKKKNV
ncbi:hypothetical protein MNBD_DELTA01-1251 [hydrothermal vent metagenome]|uniref:Uncharacterized protein n=1 Tax=hydrothermal vent metagenome TaxID=652676 RepID=A0A3B0RC84_9ZZZZ